MNDRLRQCGTATDGHDRSVAEEALRESEAKLKSIFEYSPECVSVVTLDGVFLEINPAGLALIECGQKDLAVGQPVLDLVYSDDRAVYLAQHREACAGQGGVAQLRIVGAKGSMRYLESHSVPMRNGSGKVASVLSVWRDVTERKKAEDAIRQTETRFREMASKIQDVFYDFDTVANRIIYVNPAYEKVWGRSRESLYLDPTAYMQAIHPDDAPSVRLLHQSQDGGDTIDLEYRIVRPDGSIRWINDITYPVLSSDGRVVRVVGTARDITENKRATLALMRSNRALQMLSRTNEAMSRAESESELLSRICRLALDVGGYRVAWVGYAQNDEAKSVKVMAFAGDEMDAAYVGSLRLSWCEHGESGKGPVGRTIRSGMSNAMEDITRTTHFAPWLAAAQARGYRGVINLPLRNKDATFGVMVLYAHGMLTASDDEIKLLQELADDVAFGIGNLRSQEERRRIQAAVLEADARIRDQASLLDKAQDAIIVRGIDRRILFWNKGAERLYGWTPEEALGAPIDALFRDDPTAYGEATRAVRELGEWSGEITQQRKDGSTLTVESRWTLVRDAQGRAQSILTINTDITLRKKAEREIQHLAFYDPLTALPNRLLLLERLRQALAISSRSRHMGALLFIDLDNFKTLNDTLGHDKGDLLLQQVAQRLIACVRESDTVARLGGDEFVVMLEELSEDPYTAANQAKAVGEKILAAFNRPYQVACYDHHTTPSIGATLFSDELNDVDDLLKRADLAMYQAKAAGRNAIRFFDPAMQAVVTARTALEADLRLALQNQEFFLHYHPQLSADDRIVGAEALLRWRHPARGMVSPVDFIPLAEETGLILPLGRWVLETACRQLVAWSARPAFAHLSIAVNVSARQFRHPEFAEQVLALLDDTGAEPRKLKLELTESLLVDSLDDTIVKMSALKARGVGFSLDDFGTGYSSLSYLKRLPLDQLKIDQSFVRDVLTDSNDASIARTIVALAHSLGLSVIAEGVETEAQRNFLAAHGCDAYQGYWFSRPLPIAELERFMQDFRSNRMAP
ncbi:MAG: hypothetical protein JWQ00_2220 [Noviherbaspirillum sp.]|nr:hypothetical protein [Noviherbaspirillum sp.]